jgi:hypothetical protein
MAGSAVAAFACCFLLKEPGRVDHMVREGQATVDATELPGAVAIGA